MKKKKRLVLGIDFDFWGVEDAEGVLSSLGECRSQREAAGVLDPRRLGSSVYEGLKPVRIKMVAVRP